MSTFLALAFLFFIGSVLGWVLELLFRRFISANNPERKWINPGFCTGPYLPLYGSGLCIMFVLSELGDRFWDTGTIWGKILLFVLIGVCMTAIEYIAGWASLHHNHVRLWDYSHEWGNIEGIICPKFSLIWSLLGVAYYLLVHPHILDSLRWLSENLAFSFVIGMFFGVFIIDAAHSAQLMAKLRRYAEENDVIVRLEELKAHIRAWHDHTRRKYSFFRPLRSELPMTEQIAALKANLEEKKAKLEQIKKSIRER